MTRPRPIEFFFRSGAALSARRSVLETLRQPLEEGRVTISRAAGTMTFPSEFMLVAAMNPTPDGKMPGESRCSPREIQNYLGRISGPLLDRIDLHVEVPAVPLWGRLKRPAHLADRQGMKLSIQSGLIRRREGQVSARPAWGRSCKCIFEDAPFSSTRLLTRQFRNVPSTLPCCRPSLHFSSLSRGRIGLISLRLRRKDNLFTLMPQARQQHAGGIGGAIAPPWNAPSPGGVQSNRHFGNPTGLSAAADSKKCLGSFANSERVNRPV